jgi:hypothetical protein
MLKIRGRKKLCEVGQSIYKIPLVLPVSLELQRKKLERTLVTAQKRLKNFAGKNGWEALFPDNGLVERAGKKDFLAWLRQVDNQ